MSYQTKCWHSPKATSFFIHGSWLISKNCHNLERIKKNNSRIKNKLKNPIKLHKGETFLILLPTGLCRANYTGEKESPSPRKVGCRTKPSPLWGGSANLTEQEAFGCRVVAVFPSSSRGGRLLLNVLLWAIEITFKLKMKGERLRYPILIASYVAVSGSFTRDWWSQD